MTECIKHLYFIDTLKQRATAYKQLTEHSGAVVEALVVLGGVRAA